MRKYKNFFNLRARKFDFPKCKKKFFEKNIITFFREDFFLFFELGKFPPKFFNLGAKKFPFF